LALWRWVSAELGSRFAIDRGSFPTARPAARAREAQRPSPAAGLSRPSPAVGPLTRSFPRSVDCRACRVDVEHWSVGRDEPAYAFEAPV
jgi:hypothetical protein